MVMEAYILGSGGSMPLPNRHLTSLLLRREGESFLFDCGEGTQVALRRMNLRWKSINTIFISHTHADHITGLPGLLMLTSQVERTEPLSIIGPPKIREYIEANRRALEMHINYPIRICEIENPQVPGVVLETDEYLVRSFPLKHARVCVGYSFVEKPRPGVFYPEKASQLGIPRGPLWGTLQKGEPVSLEDGRSFQPSQVAGPARPGRKVSFVTDTLPVESIIPEVLESDLFFCEGMFDDAHEAAAKEKKHMTARQAAKLAKAARVKSLGLFHFSPRYTDRELQPLLEQAAEEFPEAFLARDRYTCTIPYQE